MNDDDPEIDLSEEDLRSAVTAINSLANIVHKYAINGMAYSVEIDDVVYDVVAERRGMSTERLKDAMAKVDQGQ